MPEPTIRPAFSNWPMYDRQIRAAVEGLTAEQLALRPTAERWPIWASIGHQACQRVSWLCGFIGEPGAESTPFPDALHRCPGDEYLEPAMDGPHLAAALESTFRIIDHILDTWTLDMLDEVIRRDFGPRPWIYSRGSILQRVFAHDVYHAAELNEVLSREGLPLVDIWD